MLYALVTFLSAFLLFLVQPLIGKYILPWFGGSPAVWSAALLFFQALLLAGYAYSYGLIRRCSRRHQGQIHLAVLSGSLALLGILALCWPTPITPGASWQPSDGSAPLGRVLLLLLVSVGLPYWTLATTSPLLQAWFGTPQERRSPYRLYALSNIGSLLALLAYPFVFEPLSTVQTQAWLWSGGYALFVAGCGRLAWQQLRHTDRVQPDAPRPAQALPPALHRALWVALPATASLLLVAVTNQITQDIAVVPFLWILPLALYLLSFIICFGSAKIYGREFILALLVVTLFFARARYLGSALGLGEQLLVYGSTLLVAAIVCHGELVRLRPEPQHLTMFYLFMALGSALGALFVNLVAPLIFNTFWELPLGVALCWAVVFVVLQLEPPQTRLNKASLPLAAVALTVIGVVTLIEAQRLQLTALEQRRNFYGALRVTQEEVGDGELLYVLRHGFICHGQQFVDPARRDEPTAYFYEDSGVGLLLSYFPRAGRGLRVGVLGLGAGTLAAYGQPGDTFRFYEINPTVIALAQGEGGYFSYLRDTPATVEIMPGDARLSLERELAAGGSEHYDVLVLDVFSGDAIPVHLLTREAFELYLAHLDAGGALAVHISNQYLDLEPVLKTLAEDLGLQAVLVNSAGDGAANRVAWWVLLSRDPAILAQPEIAAHSRRLESHDRSIRLWTDSYSNLFQILY